MAKKLVSGIMALMLLACIQRTFAMSEGMMVTKETQAQLGLDFTLSAVRLSKDAISVRMEIHKQGNLQNLKAVRMIIGEGTPLLWSTLEAKPDEKGVLVVTFQISPDLADKCSLNLVVPNVPVTTFDYEHFYAVELKGYVTDKK